MFGGLLLIFLQEARTPSQCYNVIKLLSCNFKEAPQTQGRKDSGLVAFPWLAASTNFGCWAPDNVLNLLFVCYSGVHWRHVLKFTEVAKEFKKGIDGSARKPVLRQDTGYMVEKNYHMAPYLGAFEAYLLPQ